MKVISQAFEAITDDRYFETFCNAVLTAAGFKPDPRCGSGDRGRDAINDVCHKCALNRETKTGKLLDSHGFSLLVADRLSPTLFRKDADREGPRTASWLIRTQPLM